MVVQINGGADIVRALFEKVGVQAVESVLLRLILLFTIKTSHQYANLSTAETVCGKRIYGYYPCDSPPKIGFNIGGENFVIEREAFRWKDDGANNCTAIMTGIPNFNEGWTVGQPFM